MWVVEVFSPGILCGVPEDLLGSDAQEAARCPDPGLRSVKGAGDRIYLPLMRLYKMCMGGGSLQVRGPRHWPSASHSPASHFPHIENEIPGNPPFCWDLWVSVFCSEVHSKYFH